MELHWPASLLVVLAAAGCAMRPVPDRHSAPRAHVREIGSPAPRREERLTTEEIAQRKAARQAKLLLDASNAVIFCQEMLQAHAHYGLPIESAAGRLAKAKADLGRVKAGEVDGIDLEVIGTGFPLVLPLRLDWVSGFFNPDGSYVAGRPPGVDALPPPIEAVAAQASAIDLTNLGD